MGKIWSIVFFTGALFGALVCYLSQSVVGAALRTDPNISLKDWLTVILAGAALTVSLSALVFNFRKSRQDTFLAIHEKLIALDLQEGRRLLFQKIISADAPGNLLANSPEEYQKVNRALAMYDVLGLYVKRRYVSKAWVMEEWGANLAKAREPGRLFIAHRKGNGVPSLWPNFDALSREASIRHQK